MGFTNFRGIQEMGIISGGGLLISLVPMMTLLPVLLLRAKHHKKEKDHHDQDEPKKPVKKTDRRARLEQLWLRNPGRTLAVILFITLVAGWKTFSVYFDYNLLNMQSAGLPAVVLEKKLIDSATNSVLFGAVIANSIEEANELEKKIAKLPSVGSVKSMSSYMAGDVTKKLAIIREVKQELATLDFPEPDKSPVNTETLHGALYSLQGYLGLALDSIHEEIQNLPAIDHETNVLITNVIVTTSAPPATNQDNGKELIDLEQKLTSLRNSVIDLQLHIQDGLSEKQNGKLSAYQQALFNDIQGTFNSLKSQDDSGPLRADDLPIALKNRFIGRTGKYLLQVFPKDDVWKRENQIKFVKELRALDPNVTGTPVQLLEYTTLLKNSYQEARRICADSYCIPGLPPFSAHCLCPSLIIACRCGNCVDDRLDGVVPNSVQSG